jgi:hypothetical protein
VNFESESHRDGPSSNFYKYLDSSPFLEVESPTGGSLLENSLAGANSVVGEGFDDDDEELIEAIRAPEEQGVRDPYDNDRRQIVSGPSDVHKEPCNKDLQYLRRSTEWF